jgi:hypothetical protein
MTGNRALSAILRVLFLLVLVVLLFSPAVQAQSRGHEHGGKQSHSQSRGGRRGTGEANHVQHGRDRDGHRRDIDRDYREHNFGREHRIYCGPIYGRRTFLIGGIWFGLDVWPSFWLASDYVYVDYVDGDYFLVDERVEASGAIVLGTSRVAIIIN